MLIKTNILTMFLFAASLTLPTNGCGGGSPSNVREFDCTKSKISLFDVPGTPSIKIKTSRCNDYIYKPESVSRVLHKFVKEYADTFDIDTLTLWNMLSSLEIEVSVIPKIINAAFDTKGNLVTNVYVTGLAVSPSKIWVEIKTGQIWSSSLTHELVHIVIWHINGKIHGDPDHEGTRFSGWTAKHTKFIKHFNLRLMELAL
jgi:hypothetical protein